MDSKIEAVFADYDARMQRERENAGQMKLDDFLLPVGPQTGALLNSLIKGAKATRILEIGTSYGYSGVWLAEAARETGGKLITLDVADYKQAYAKAALEKAGLAAFVDFRCGSALDLIPTLPGPFDFVLLDLWKDLYVPCLELFFPKLAPGAIVVADNMLQPAAAREEALAYRRAVRAKPGVASVLLPIGSGIEISRLGDL
ncbi:MAG: O-methyltransferase [Caulobacterales bacterium]